MEFTLMPVTIWRSRDSSFRIVTCYGLEGPGIESQWERDFSAPVQTGPGVHPASYTKSTGLFPGVKRPGRGVDHPPPSSAEVKERVQLYLYSPSGPSWSVIVWNVPFTFYATIWIMRNHKLKHKEMSTDVILWTLWWTFVSERGKLIARPGW